MNNGNMDMPMKWHNFLIYFALWAGAVLNIVGAFSTYAQNNALLYDIYGKLRSVDIMYIAASVILAVFIIYTRFQLAGLKATAPGKLTWCYILSIIVTLGYLLGVSAATGIRLAELNIGSTIASVISSIVMMIVNNIYYGKREHMFLN